MRVAIRTDASILIGSGHVMRCLALAERLRASNAEVLFICRDHDGHLCDLIAARGMPVSRLQKAAHTNGLTGYDAWLGVTQTDDARETGIALQRSSEWDWLIVDHYALDKGWEQLVAPYVKRLFVIDDLANREHSADALLDQCGGEEGESVYRYLVPPACHLLEGPRYALLRPEFAEFRKTPCCREKSQRLLLFFGGSDLDNITEKAIHAIQQAALPGVHVDVVVGASHPHKAALDLLCGTLPRFQSHAHVGNMAKLMSNADLAVGAGGVTLWERCALGLPSIVLSCAENQERSCNYAAANNAILYLGRATTVSTDRLAQAFVELDSSPLLRKEMSAAGQLLVDAQGASRVVRFMHSESVQIGQRGPQ